MYTLHHIHPTHSIPSLAILAVNKEERMKSAAKRLQQKVKQWLPRKSVSQFVEWLFFPEVQQKNLTHSNLTCLVLRSIIRKSARERPRNEKITSGFFSSNSMNFSPSVFDFRAEYVNCRKQDWRVPGYMWGWTWKMASAYLAKWLRKQREVIVSARRWYWISKKIE